jgi:hypothetical protein
MYGEVERAGNMTKDKVYNRQLSDVMWNGMVPCVKRFQKTSCNNNSLSWKNIAFHGRWINCTIKAMETFWVKLQ